MSYHLLPFFKSHRLDQITIREVDRYKTAKAAEGVLAPTSVNKTLTRLAQILAVAVEYELIAANPATGRRRRLKTTKPARPWVEPEQLMALLDAASRRYRPLLAVLAGAGLRIGEAVELEWRHVDLATGTLRVGRSKTEAGIRIVDLTPAVREELALHRANAVHTQPTDPVFCSRTARRQNRHNLRRSALLPAIKKANVALDGVGIDPIEKTIGFHSLRRTYASLRSAVGDDPAYTAEQIGHEDPTFTLRVYTHATKRRGRLTGAHQLALDQALDWARMGTNEELAPAAVIERMPVEQ